MMSGVWWIPTPDDSRPPSDCTPGRLGEHESAPRELALDGRLAQGDLSNHGPLFGTAPLVWGRTRDGHPVTLFDVHHNGTHERSSRTPSISPGASEQWECAWYATRGTHLTPDAVADSVTVEFDALQPWINPFHDTPHDDRQAFDTHAKTFTTPEPWRASVTLGDCRLTVSHDWSLLTIPGGPFTATQQAHFSIEGAILVKELCSTWIAPLHDFLLFWTLGHVTLTRVTACIKTAPGGPPYTVALHLPPLVLGGSGDAPPMPLGMLATRRELDALDVGIDTLLEAWFDIRAKHRMALRYLVASQEPSHYAEVNLLFACLSAEGYHKAVMTGTRWPNEVHKAMVSGVTEAIRDTKMSGEELQWVEQRLSEGNRKGQKTVMGDVCSAAGATYDYVSKQWPKFDALVVYQRNKAAHSNAAPLARRG